MATHKEDKLGETKGKVPIRFDGDQYANVTEAIDQKSMKAMLTSVTEEILLNIFSGIVTVLPARHLKCRETQSHVIERKNHGPN